ncbi:MAG: NAD(P)-dependent oxidoreductase [Bdellovibrionales bacterium]|nr:NAD(P)-dependent oxidoreductase [Bdellovibrionales bacterium]
MTTPFKLLIFGGSGFIGKRLAVAAAQKGIDVAIASRKNSAHFPKFFFADLADASSLSQALNDFCPTHVINCATTGVNPNEHNDLLDFFKVNAIGPSELRKLCDQTGVLRFIHLSSCFECGSQAEALTEATSLRPTAPYGISKAAGTHLLVQGHDQFRVETLIFRLFVLWGVGESSHRLVSSILRAKNTGQKLALSRGDQIRDFAFVEDIVDSMLRLMTHTSLKSGEVVNVASGEPIRVGDFALKIAETLGCQDLLEFGSIPNREEKLQSLPASIEKLRTLIGTPKKTSLADGLAMMQKECP